MDFFFPLVQELLTLKSASWDWEHKVNVSVSYHRVVSKYSHTELFWILLHVRHNRPCFWEL